MLNIKFLTTGNLKEAYWRDALSEYSKRLGGLCRFTCAEFKEVRLSDNPSQAEIDAELESEGEKILAEFSPREQEVIRMRFVDGMTQAQIAEYLGVSQVQVSRLLRRTLQRMQEKLDPGM